MERGKEMKLQDLLYSLPGETEVGIWDIRNPTEKYKRKFEKSPTRQTYRKVKNLSYHELRDLLQLDVLCVNVYRDGLLIRVYHKEVK